MSRVIVVNNVTPDGVMQAPGRPDEDLRGGFRHGGWALPYNDSVKGRVMAEGIAQAASLLFGRRTYQDFFRVWPGRAASRSSRHPISTSRSRGAAGTRRRPPSPSKCAPSRAKWRLDTRRAGAPILGDRTGLP